MEKFASKIVEIQRSRVKDSKGSGQYHASRGHRLHKGLDIQTKTGEKIYSPISAKIIRKSRPYKDDSRYSGLYLKGTGIWKGYEMKIFYLKPISTFGDIRPGAIIGYAQDLTIKYPGITNHVHFQVKKNGAFINPFDLWQKCF